MSVFAALMTGCSGTEQGSEGQAGTGNITAGGRPASEGGSSGSTAGGGALTAGTGGSPAAAEGGGAANGSLAGSTAVGVGGTAAVGVGGTAAVGGGGSAAIGGTGATAGGSGTSGMAGASGSAGGGGRVPGCGNAAAVKGARNLTIQVSGKARTYVLFVPNGYDASKSIPLIFAWHSSGASGAESRRYYKLEPVTGDGAIIVYPDGLNGAWDLSANGVDMKFFDLLLESISKEYCVDQSRVFSTGYSFGGMMSHSLACDRGSKLRAFAPMAGAFFDGTKSCPTPVPAWIAHASNDPTVSFTSGEAARDIWLKTNGCSTTTMAVSPSPCVAYQCTKAPVTWCVHTQGHVWPNFASKGVWDFFKSL